MWILDSEGDFLNGKRVWLRPGKKYLFGRIKQDDVRHAIQNNTISRKHMVIEVSHVKPGDGSHIYTKSELFVSDQGSKHGTVVDGEQIRGNRKLLSEAEHTIKLGKYPSALRIKWQPTVLSFSFSSKELKAKDPLARIRSRLEDLDIKTIIPYVIDSTTHVVQSKRNTAKGLQALVNGKYIVQESYIDALVYAATPSDLENLESLSPLETDFDASWPDPSEHLPPPGKEVIHRPKEAFAPNPERTKVFEDYTFVFGDPGQYDSLQAPITNGHGKALFYKVENGVTTAQDIVQFMKSAASQKGFGDQREGPGGVVLVRFRAKGNYEDWSIQLSNDVAVMTDQRVIEQSEFLDAILENDASCLCRTLPESTASQEMEGESAPVPASTPHEPSGDVQVVSNSQPSEEVSQPAKRAKGGRTRKFVSKMKTFDDGFDINSIPVYTPDEGHDSIESLPTMAVDESMPSQRHSQRLSDLSHREEKVDEEDMVSSLLPGANAMKRRRAEMSSRVKDDLTPNSNPGDAPRPKRPKLDVLEAARQHREAEDAERQRRQEEEASLQTSLQDVDVEKLKGLVIVEDMEIPSKSVDDENSHRWDDRWNGRKNFKKFRRKGDGSQPRRRIQAVIVPLEEVTRRNFGIGDHYWVSSHRSTDQSVAESHQERPISQETSEPSQIQSFGRSGSEKTPVPRSQKRPHEDSDEDSDNEPRFRFRRRK